MEGKEETDGDAEDGGAWQLFLRFSLIFIFPGSELRR